MLLVNASSCERCRRETRLSPALSLSDASLLPSNFIALSEFTSIFHPFSLNHFPSEITSDSIAMDDMLYDAFDVCEAQLLLDGGEDENDDLLYNDFWPSEDYLIDDNDSDDEMLMQYPEVDTRDLLLIEPTVDSTMSLTTIGKIEKVFEAIADAMLAEDSPDLVLPITIRSRARASLTSQSSISRPRHTINFPGKTPAEAWRFSQQPYSAL